MNEELLFEMVQQCVDTAVSRLESSTPLSPFAMTITSDFHFRHFESDQPGDTDKYDALVATLQELAGSGTIEAVAILARVDIPANFNPEVSSGLRVHIEERSKAEQKISGRFLYIPYQLYNTTGDESIQVQLFNPIPVAFPAEIF